MKNVYYFLPAIIACIFYSAIALLDGFNMLSSVVWLLVALLVVSAFLMSKGKWWGCVLGIVVGIGLIYMGMQETGQIFKEWPLGLFLCVYYAIGGLFSKKQKKV